MKKSLFLIAIFSLLITVMHAQLVNTKWNGTAYLLMQDQSLKPAAITWNFGKDTVKVIFPETGGEPEVLTYSTQKNIMTFVKVSGGSPCDPGATGKLKFEIKGDELFLQLVESGCEAFTKALSDKPYTRVK